MSETFFRVPKPFGEEYAALSDQEKIDRLEEELQSERMREAERKTYLSVHLGEIRSALHTVMGYAVVAQEDLHDPEGLREDLELIISKGKEAVGVLSDIKRHLKSGDFSERKGDAVKRWDYILNNFGRMIKPELLKKQLTMHVDFSGVVHMQVPFGLFKIQQILWNLAENAVQFTPEKGEIFVRVSESRAEPSGERTYEIQIKDTGIGIREDFLPHVFDPYAREKRAEVRRVEGEGIGLTLLKRTVDWMKGTIQVESVVNKGTTFTVILPVLDGE